MNTAEEIKQKLDILEVIGDSASLQKVGRNYRGLCPFHQEKTPSFYVFPERGSWYCFGRCNEGGDVFSFVMKRENLSFGEALRRLAERAGVALTPPAQNETARQEKEELYLINEAAARFYHRLLLSPPGQGVREYLRGRGVVEETIPAFTLGYAPPGWHNLGPHLRQLGYSPEQGKRAGLLIGEGTEPHDLFHHRLLFPIWEAGGRVAGFGGRALDTSLPKYLNSPATPVFDKKSLLYGLDRAKEAIRKQDRAVIVEGYMDALIAHQEGFPETVATMGVALTENQLLTLKRLTRNLVLALDADEAGVEAVLRGAEKIEGIYGGGVAQSDEWRETYKRILNSETRVLALPSGKDPDEIILKDRQEWEKLLASAQPVMDFLLDQLARQLDLTELAGKRSLVDKLKPLFSGIDDPIRRGHYLQKLARWLKMEERLLSAALSPGRRPRGETLPSPSPAPHPLIQFTFLSEQERLLSLLLQYPQLREAAEQVEAGLFENPRCRELFRLWQQDPQLPGVAGEPALSELAQRLRDAPPHPIPLPQREAALQHLALSLRDKQLRTRQQLLQQLLAETPSLESQEAEIKALNSQLLEVGRQLHTLSRARRE